MSNGDLKLMPHHLSDHKWWYEEPEGITVLAAKSTDPLFDATQVFIPWKDIRAALKRKDKKYER